MSKLGNFVVPQWRDAEGTSVRPYSSCYPKVFAELGPYSSLLTAMEAASACTLEGVIVQFSAPWYGTGGTSTTPLASDRLVIQVQNDVSSGFVSIPGPKDGLFLADGETFDASSALGAPLVTAILASLGDMAGNRWTSVVGGKRVAVEAGPGSR